MLAERAEVARREAQARAEAAQARLARGEEQGESKSVLLGQRLEQAVQELQGTAAERDQLAAKLEEALGRCTSSPHTSALHPSPSPQPIDDVA